MNQSAPPTDPRLLVLHALRLSGYLPGEKISARSGLSVDEVGGLLGAALADELVKQRTGRISGWVLTPAGRAAHAELLAEELRARDCRAEVELADSRFVELNEPFKKLCTRWQLRDDTAEATPNDHSDPAYDAAIVRDLAGLHPGVVAATQDLAGSLPRFGRYPRDFDAALRRLTGGETSAFARPMSDSYHDVWMELHQDLMSTLGRERGAADGH